MGLEAVLGKNRPARKRDDVMEKRCLRLTDSNVLEEKLLVLKIFCKLILSTLIQQTADPTSPATTTRNQTSLVAAKEMFLLLIPKLASQLRRFLSVLVGMSVLRTASVPMTVMLTAPAQSTNIICLFIESKLFEEKIFVSNSILTEFAHNNYLVKQIKLVEKLDFQLIPTKESS